MDRDVFAQSFLRASNILFIRPHIIYPAGVSRGVTPVEFQAKGLAMKGLLIPELHVNL